MINVMFWNTNIYKHSEVDEAKCFNIENAIRTIAIERNCDIIVLAEFDLDENRLCQSLNENKLNFTIIKTIGNTRIKILARKFLKSEPLRESSHYIIYDISWEGAHFFLVGVHFPSKLHDENRQKFICGQLANDILKVEESMRHKNTIVIGDFNANPFEEIMVDFGFMHAIYDSEIVLRKQERTCCGQKRQLFYNPMWNILGDDKYPKGSYYCENGNIKKLYWNVFDQVLMSPNVVKGYKRDSLELITSVKKCNLIDKRGIPNKKNYSDHLPLVFSFEEGVL